MNNVSANKNYLFVCGQAYRKHGIIHIGEEDVCDPFLGSWTELRIIYENYESPFTITFQDHEECLETFNRIMELLEDE